MRLYRDGSVRITKYPWYPSERRRINENNPHGSKLQLYSYRGKIFAGIFRKSGREIPPRRFPQRFSEKQRYGFIISRDGKARFEGVRFEDHRRAIAQADNLTNKSRCRGWYWTRRVRNLYTDRSQCRFRGVWNDRWRCDRRRSWPRPTVPTEFTCGCRTYRKNLKFKGTVESILAEENATVRMAMMQLYGIAKFFEDAKAEMIHEEHGYQLLQLETGTSLAASAATIRALKMKCPSTGQTYVLTVPNTCRSVEESLDWMFGTQNYFSVVGQQT